MAHGTAIEWTHIPGFKGVTWNPVAGCSKVSEGCRNCYAIRDAHRLGGNPNPKISSVYSDLTVVENGSPNWTGKVRVLDQRLEQPLHWKNPRAVFVNSMSDLFHEEIPNEFIAKVLMVASVCPEHIFMILTKRAKRMAEFFESPDPSAAEWIYDIAPERALAFANQPDEPPPNIWLGVSAEDQATANERIPFLLEAPASRRFVSLEPLLGEIDLTKIFPEDVGGDLPINVLTPFDPHSGIGHLDWIIFGGESGDDARPLHPNYPRKLRDQGIAAGIPIFFKQWGEHLPSSCLPAERNAILALNENLTHLAAHGETFWKVGKKAAGSLLDGKHWQEFPTS